MSIAICAIMMAVCVACIFGMGIVGKLVSRFRRSDESGS
jgi:hypothetical protein